MEEGGEGVAGEAGGGEEGGGGQVSCINQQLKKVCFEVFRRVKLND